MSLVRIKEADKPSFEGRVHTCPLRGDSTQFQLVDEQGDGKPYAGLVYQVTDYENVVHEGRLDANGMGKVDQHYCGPVVLRFNQLYGGSNEDYTDLMLRKHYPLPITELQVRAEKTRFINKSGARTEANPAQEEADTFYQVEVRELVDHAAHLPAMVERRFPPNTRVHSLFRQEAQGKKSTAIHSAFKQGAGNVDVTPEDRAMAELGFAPPARLPRGIALMPNRRTVLEVRPLRALRPMISPSNDFCALNLYQLALMATLSYSDFAQQPSMHPIHADRVEFAQQPSVGNWFGDALPKFDELWQVDAGQAGGRAYYPLYEEVPYSRRLEIVPFDPELYPEANSPDLGDKQESPASIHSLDDLKDDEGSDTQAFITHHEGVILISIRGTASAADALRDLDATQVPFEEGVGKVHNGFYGAAKVAYRFAVRYLDKFYSGQKLVITGHSLGGAIALLVAEMLRHDERYAEAILLYTYGAPRVGDQTFVKGAAALAHHRIVNHNDPVPSVPATWMNTSTRNEYIGQALLTALSPAIGVSSFALGMVNIVGEPYEHHGQLQHFMPVHFGNALTSSILWAPSCSTINDHGCVQALQIKGGLPQRDPLLRQLVDNAHHKMVASYIPRCWASLRRWQQAYESKAPAISYDEIMHVYDALTQLQGQLRVELSRRSAASDHARQAQDKDIDALCKEIQNLITTQQRLYALRHRSLTEAEVYGVYAGTAELEEEHLPRWKAHADVTRSEPWAMAPAGLHDDEKLIASIVNGYKGYQGRPDINSRI